MILNRYNPLGLTFQISPAGRDKSTVTLIGAKGSNKTLIVNASIEDMNQGWYYWMNGKFIQDAFRFLTPDEREFLMTGITPEEWAETFKDEEDA